MSENPATPVRQWLRCLLRRPSPQWEPPRGDRPGFDKWYEQGSGDRLWEESEDPRYQAVMRQIGARRKSAPLRILDAGCGNGRVASYLSATERQLYIGVDFAGAGIGQARKRVPDATFEAGDLTDWRPRQRYDVILFNEVTYYLDAPGVTLGEFADFLAPAGCLVVSVFRYTRWKSHWHSLERGMRLVNAEIVRNSEGLTWDIKTFEPGEPHAR